MNTIAKEKFINKYTNELRTISKEKNIDVGVAIDVLVAHARNREKSPDELYSEEYYYRFTGYENLNYSELDKDIIELEETGVIPKFEV